jgi:hypothetical protein
MKQIFLFVLCTDLMDRSVERDVPASILPTVSEEKFSQIRKDFSEMGAQNISSGCSFPIILIPGATCIDCVV